MTQRVVLVGAGHAHAQVLLAWRDAPLPDVELVVVSPYALAPYSGMVPGWLAGTYRFDEIVIDFPGLCRRAGARWVPAALCSLDPEQQTLQLSNGDSLKYDWLSLNLGATLTPPKIADTVASMGESSAPQILPMRPLSHLHGTYDKLLEAWRQDEKHQTFRVTAVGGGAAGVESLLAVLQRLRRLRPERRVEGALLTQSRELLPGYPRATQRMALRALRNAAVSVQSGTSWDDALEPRSDLVLWATGAQAHAWQREPARRGALAVSPDGFVSVDQHLRSLSHRNIFAVGDCAHWVRPLPKAGVYAVRMGPVLLRNLQASLTGTKLTTYTPQRKFLSLLSTADGRAIASRGRLSLSGRWAWHLKDHIDRGFVRRFVS